MIYRKADKTHAQIKSIAEELVELAMDDGSTGTIMMTSFVRAEWDIDDKNKKTLISATSVTEKSSGKKKSEMSIHVAGLLAKKAIEKKITKVYFDRGGYKYHGRIKVFAEALRKNGLSF